MGSQGWLSLVPAWLWENRPGPGGYFPATEPRAIQARPAAPQDSCCGPGQSRGRGVEAAAPAAPCGKVCHGSAWRKPAPHTAHPAHEEAWPMVLTVPAPLCEPWAEPQIPQWDTDLFPDPLCGPNTQGQGQWWARGGGYAKASAEGPEWETPSGNKGHNKPIGPVRHSPTGLEKTTALAQEKSPLGKQSQPETRLRDASSSLLTGQLQACFWRDPVLRAMLPGLGR